MVEYERTGEFVRQLFRIPLDRSVGNSGRKHIPDWCDQAANVPLASERRLRGILMQSNRIVETVDGSICQSKQETLDSDCEIGFEITCQLVEFVSGDRSRKDCLDDVSWRRPMAIHRRTRHARVLVNA